MIAKLLPVILLLVGSGAGVGAGIYLRPPPADPTSVAMSDQGAADQVDGQQNSDAATKDDGSIEDDGAFGDKEYVKLSNQFVVPVVRNREVVALVVLALSLEVPLGRKDGIFRSEPKIRDSFLQVLFDHANVGGFEGEFTDAQVLGKLRTALREVAQRDLGRDVISDVLITEIARQDY